MHITCDKGHEHPAWYDAGKLIAEHVGTCWLITTRRR